MKHISKYLLLLFTALSMGFTSCGGDEPSDPGKPDTPVTPPFQTVEDPEGTVRFGMRNQNNGDTYLGNLHIDKADNFSVNGSGKIVDLGEMKGLGNVSYIPKIGWADKVSVVPGHGYVLCQYYGSGEPKFTRIYVLDYIVAAGSSGIIGAEIKYQEPFYGLDESIKIDEEVAIPSMGGEVTISINNKYFTPFTIEFRGGYLNCTVSRASQTSTPFIVDGITIQCEENYSHEERTRIICLKNSYGREQLIKLVQAPTGDIIYPTSILVPIPNYGHAKNIPTIEIASNIVLEDIKVENNTDWLEVRLEDVTDTYDGPLMSNHIGNLSESRASVDRKQIFRIHFDAKPNISPSARETTIKLSYGSITCTIEVQQEGVDDNRFTFQNVTYDATQHYGEVVRYDSSVYMSRYVFTMKVEDGKDWCKVSNDTQYYYVTLDANKSPQSRTAKVIVYLWGEEYTTFTVTQQGAGN